MDDFRLTAKQITTLKALHRKQRDRRFADRLADVDADDIPLVNANGVCFDFDTQKDMVFSRNWE